MREILIDLQDWNETLMRNWNMCSEIDDNFLVLKNLVEINEHHCRIAYVECMREQQRQVGCSEQEINDYWAA